VAERLRTLERIDARFMWPDEAASVTPWLAREENIARLREAFGLELEVEHTEVAVGPDAASFHAISSLPTRQARVISTASGSSLTCSALNPLRSSHRADQHPLLR
jgi:hypothetical protein